MLKKLRNGKVLYLNRRSIEQNQPKHKQKLAQKIEKLKQSDKLNKNIFITETLEAFSLSPSFIPLKKHVSRIFSRPFFVFEIGPVINLHDLKKFIGP